MTKVKISERTVQLQTLHC